MVNLKNSSVESFMNYAQGKKVYAFGASEFIRQFSIMTDFEKIIFSFTDNDSSKWGKNYTINNRTIPVISIDDFYKNIDKNDIILISTYSVISNTLEQLNQIQALNGIDCFILSRMTMKNMPILPYFEVNIVDECNLKCKGCSHFSNLFNEKSHYDLDDFKRDIALISNNCYVCQLRLLGGEPLLCDNLYDYVDFAREVFPHTLINIATNGLLLFKHPNKLFESMKKNNVYFRITPYKPAMKIKKGITDFLSSKGVKFDFGTGDTVLKFNKTLSNTFDSDPVQSMSICASRGCRFLRNGRFYKCPIEGLIYKFFDTYDIKKDLKHGIDIHSVTDWNKMLDELNSGPAEACKYCAEEIKLMVWKISANPDYSDWIA